MIGTFHYRFSADRLVIPLNDRLPKTTASSFKSDTPQQPEFSTQQGRWA